MENIGRRYDVDWLRVIAIGLLLLYHVAIGFQPWGTMIGFITYGESWSSLWLPMSLLNVWRIPLLFFVSGMGVYFALQQRSWQQLLGERTRRILLPFLSGIFLIVPIHLCLWQDYYQINLAYVPTPGHLWFLGNLFAYVVLFSPVFFFLKKHENGSLARGLRRLLSHPLGLLAVVATFVAEAWLVKPHPFELYAMTWHGFFLGGVAFFWGFCLVMSGPPCWKMLVAWRWLFFAFATLLFVVRITQFQGAAPHYLIATESVSWIVTVFAFGHRYLNHSSNALRYLSQAAYPIYIIHMIFLYLGSWLLFPLGGAAPLQCLFVLLFTVIGCLVTYEYVIRRVNFLRPLFGLKPKPTSSPQPSLSS